MFSYWDNPELIDRVKRMDADYRKRLSPYQQLIKKAWTSPERHAYRNEEMAIWGLLKKKEISVERAYLDMFTLMELYYQAPMGMTKAQADRIVNACKRLGIPAQIIAIQGNDLHEISFYHSKHITYRSYQAARLLLMSRETEYGITL